MVFVSFKHNAWLQELLLFSFGFMILSLLFLPLNVNASSLSDVVCCIVSPTQSLCYKTSSETSPNCFGSLSEYENYVGCNQQLFPNFHCLDLGACSIILNFGVSSDPLLYDACLSYYSACHALKDKDVPKPTFPESLDHTIFPGVFVYRPSSDIISSLDERLSEINVYELSAHISNRIANCELYGNIDDLIYAPDAGICIPWCFSQEDCCNLSFGIMAESLGFSNSTLLFCGEIDDGCGKTYDCGGCPEGYSCKTPEYDDVVFKDGGICMPDDGSNPISFCVPWCNGTSCCSEDSCGLVNNGCGDVIDCGNCPEGYKCNYNICEKECIPRCNSREECCGDITGGFVDDGCGNVYNCSRTESGDISYKNLVYVTLEEHNGDFYGDKTLANGYYDCSDLRGDVLTRCKVDNFCMRNIPLGIDCEDVHAFLSVSENDEIRDMPSNYGYPDDEPVYWYDPLHFSFVKLADDWDDMLDGSIDISQCDAGAGCTEGGVCAGLSTVCRLWTGSKSDGSLSKNCISWRSDYGGIGFPCIPYGHKGAVGKSDETNEMWLDVASNWLWDDSRCGLGSHVRCAGRCYPIENNIKEMENYANRHVFVVSSKDWKTVLSLVPVAIWSSKNESVLSQCQKVYNGPADVCAYPVLIYPEDEMGTCYNKSCHCYNIHTLMIDADAIIHFIDQYQPDEVDLIKLSDCEDCPESDFRNDLSQYIQEKVEDVDVFEYTPDELIKFWKDYSTVIYCEDNYSTALLASTLASLINAPLVIENGPLDKAEFLTDKVIYCVGDVEREDCSRVFSVQGLRHYYQAVTGTDKLLVVNSKDKDIFYPGEGAKEITVNGWINDYGLVQQNVSAVRDIFRGFHHVEYNIFDEDSGCKNNPAISKLGANFSLTAPFLAAAKNELLFDVNYYYDYLRGLGLRMDRNEAITSAMIECLLTHPIGECKIEEPPKTIGRSLAQVSSALKIDNKLKPYIDSGDFNYLTIVASPVAIPRNFINKVTVYGGASVNIGFTYDTEWYADDSDWFDTDPDVAVGRISGFTVSDVSSYIARDLFFDKTKTKDYVLFGASGGSHMIKRANRWIGYFDDSGYLVDCRISDEDFNGRFGWLYLDHCYDVSELKNCNYYKKIFGGLSDEMVDDLKKQPILYFYQGHSGPSWGGVYYSYLPNLNNTIIVIGACSSCQDYAGDSFCDNAIRKGALAFVGSTAVTMYAPNMKGIISGPLINLLGANTDVFHQFINGVFATEVPKYNYFLCPLDFTGCHPSGFIDGNLDFGNAFKAFYNDGDFEEMTILVGDPTFRLNPTKKLNHYLDAKFNSAWFFGICPVHNYE